MKMIRRFVPGQVSVLSDFECDVTICTRNLALDNDVWDMEGVDLSKFNEHPIALWSHDVDLPIGRVSNVQVHSDKITGRVTFAPAGASAKADEVRALVKSGIVTGISAGIVPLEIVPLGSGRGRRRVTKSLLMECSFCSVPIDTASGVTARGKQENDDMAEWKVGAARNLPIDNSDDWDGDAAKTAIFDHAGGDDFKPDVARRGFLVYDAEKPEDRGSYKLPIATVRDGKLVVPKGAIRAAASRLPDTDIPDDVKKRAGSVLNAYKKKAKIGDEEDGERSYTRAYRRMFGPRISLKRDLYDVASLCWTMMQLNGQAHASRIEAALEGDESEVPELLLEVLHELGEALKAMTEEEVEECLAAHEADDDDDEDEELEEEERAFIAGGKSALARTWRRAMVAQRAGKKLSKSNAETLDEAEGHHTRALKHHRALGEHHDAVGEKHEEMRALHDKMHEALEDADEADDENDDEEADRAMERCRSLHEEMGRALDDASDRHEDVGDAHRAMGRSLKAAQRCVRSVLGRSVEGEDDKPADDNKDSKEERARRAKALSLKGKLRAMESETA